MYTYQIHLAEFVARRASFHFLDFFRNLDYFTGFREGLELSKNISGWQLFEPPQIYQEFS